MLIIFSFCIEIIFDQLTGTAFKPLTLTDLNWVINCVKKQSNQRKE